eukprot:COSAG06_NODE_56294_length_285_cov_1.102151_2_plen_52_part_01
MAAGAAAGGAGVFARPCMQVCFENCVRRLKDDDPRLKVRKRLSCNASVYSKM